MKKYILTYRIVSSNELIYMQPETFNSDKKSDLIELANKINKSFLNWVLIAVFLQKMELMMFQFI